MSAMNDLIILIRERLEQKTVTITSLAASAGCSREYVYRLLAGDSHPTVPVAEKLAAAVGAEVSINVRKTRASEKTSKKLAV